MMTFRAGAPGGVAQAAAYTAHLLERTIDPAQQALADYYGRESSLDPERSEGLGSTPRPSPVMAPEVARALGIDASRPLTAAELGNILGGLRADGRAMPGHQRDLRAYRSRADGADAPGERSRIAWIDLTFSAPKSVSVAWMAAATEAERQSIHQAHKDAVQEALGYVEQEVARATFGHGRSGQAEETGRLGFVSIDHFTSRPTVEISRADPTTGVQATEIYSVPVAGDPQLHSHTIVPNLVLTRSGRAMSIDTTRIAGRVHEFGAVYQALLGRNLRRLGMAVELDERTQALRLAAIPEEICQAFSKRTVNGERSAEAWARRHGYSAEAWAGMRPEQRVAMLKAAIKEGRFGKGDDLADRAAWRAQIAELGWQYSGSAVRMGPPAPERSPRQRAEDALAGAAPVLEGMLAQRAVVTGSDLRLAAARGLIAGGMETLEDLSAVTRAMARDGVRQDGQQTALLFRPGASSRPERVRVTTALHRDQEAELIALARTAQAQPDAALAPARLVQAAAARGTPLTNEQLHAAEALGAGNKFAVVIGGAGVGKTTILAPLVEGWSGRGREVWGTALAWRQANALQEAGISGARTLALEPLLDRMQRRPQDFGPRSVVALDELGQIGTRQLLQLLRQQAQLGFKLVAVGDDRQCQAIEAGPTIALLRQALGPEAIPEVLSTVRQATERERAIVGMFRDGRIGEALAAKRAEGQAELVQGGYEAAVRRAAALWGERVAANQQDPRYSVTVSAPTNQDALAVSRAIREVRRASGQLGPDRVTIEASDATGASYPLPLAEGDRVRLFQRTSRAGAGRDTMMGENGSVLTVKEVREGGLLLTTRDGKEGFVPWKGFRDRRSGQIRLAYGDVLTINTAQGITSDEHILAMPAGSRGVTLYAAHVGASRHRVASHIVGSLGAEAREVEDRRPVNAPKLTGQAALDAAWANVERNFGRAPVKDSALALLRRFQDLSQKARDTFQEGMRRRQTRQKADLPETRLVQRARENRQAKTLAPVVRQMSLNLEVQGRAAERLGAAPRPRPRISLEALTLRLVAPQVAEGRMSYSTALDEVMLSAVDDRRVRVLRDYAWNPVHQMHLPKPGGPVHAEPDQDAIARKLDQAIASYDAGGPAALWAPNVLRSTRSHSAHPDHIRRDQGASKGPMAQAPLRRAGERVKRSSAELAANTPRSRAPRRSR
ncbi:aldehyde dehydrogenase [Pseudoroseomonas rhizosphaerae]|uniref:Aldehyde dehydrogenase n=1 Tax=Teichococcus rhizosphaerae TaxID=1335062 RepID=A0A2C7A3G6_9PROT|nr:MobF family relaxase [Pseudoroseomonas rhizosphaerae]PHK92880.1 aldehyde dehydrogenase [Pseudoroseomonas rhizosphaerae]